MKSELRHQIHYLSKIILGLVIVSGIILLAFLGDAISLDPGVHRWLYAAILFFFAVCACVISYSTGVAAYYYNKADELEQQIYAHACVRTIHIGLPLLAIIGTLELAGWVPILNMMWYFIAFVILLGIQLMFSDRNFH